ncbi:MAG TPA: zf-HC2 domain-containing protein [Thermoanaerobaculia bacterium]|nr:zf-HC2 domain-containing protein [Thermoanaerobaculia bacterium]
MTCRRVEKALPPFVGRDLDPSRMASVAAHLAACERCRSLQVELAGSRAWLEASPAPPIPQADYATMRRAVWHRIETGAGKHASGRAGRLVLASAGILAVAFAAILVFRARLEIPRAPGRAASAPHEEAAAVAAPPARSLEEPSSPSAPVQFARHSPRKPVRPAGRGAESSVVRIEFTTANPDVRIIWLVKKGEAAPAAAPAGRNQEVS